jgi:hypothetical protein
MEKEEETDSKAVSWVPGRGFVISRDEFEERKLREKSVPMSGQRRKARWRRG